MAKQGLIGTGVEPLAGSISAAYDTIIRRGRHPSRRSPRQACGGTPTPSPRWELRRSRSDRASGSAAVQGTGHFELDEIMVAAAVIVRPHRAGSVRAHERAERGHADRASASSRARRWGSGAQPPSRHEPHRRTAALRAAGSRRSADGVPPSERDGRSSHCTRWPTSPRGTRTIGIDLPGYGRSPKGGGRCDDGGDRPSVLVGCRRSDVRSGRPRRLFGRRLAGALHGPPRNGADAGDGADQCRLQPRQGVRPPPDRVVPPARRRVPATLRRAQPELGRRRWRRTWSSSSASATTGPTGRRSSEMFRALEQPDPDWLWSGISVPTLVITGTQDNAHPRALVLPDHIPTASWP